MITSLFQTPIYLHYNSGRHISTDGQDFNALLVPYWPVPVEEVVIVAHSMGGLVTRSANNSKNRGPSTSKKTSS